MLCYFIEKALEIRNVKYEAMEADNIILIKFRKILYGILTFVLKNDRMLSADNRMVSGYLFFYGGEIQSANN